MKAAELQGSGQGEKGTFDRGSGYTGFSGGLPMLLGPCVDGPNLCHCANQLMRIHVSVPGWLVTKAGAKVILST